MFYGDFYMKDYLRNYMEENSKSLKVLGIFIVIGILIGIIFFCLISQDAKQELLNMCKETLNMTKQENFNRINIILNGSIKYIVVLIIIYISSFLIIGENITMALATIKGICIGMYSYILINVFGGAKGVFSMLLIIVIPNLIYIPAYLYSLINSRNLNFNILCKNVTPSIILKELVNAIVSISLMFLSLIIEQSLCNVVIDMWRGI